MKHKSGLHKKVSSIFDGASLPRELAGNSPLNSSDSSAQPKSTGDFQKSQYTNFSPFSGQTNNSFANSGSTVSLDQQYNASQKRKLFLMIGLSVLLVLVLFFNFKPGKKVTPIPDNVPDSQPPAKVSQIQWLQPQIWNEDNRDPMVYVAYTEKTVDDESFIIKGIVRPPQGKPSVLVGTEILYEGDQIQGWTVKQILKDIVCLEKPDGQKKRIKMAVI